MTRKKALSIMKDKMSDSQKAKRFAEDHVLIRFLRARTLDVDQAWEMWCNACHWRETFDGDGIDAFMKKHTYMPHEPFVNTISRSIWNHKCDKDGRLVFIDMCGMMDVAKYSEAIDVETAIRIHVWGMENMSNLMELSSRRLGKRVSKIVCINDLSDMPLYGVKHWPMVNYFKILSVIDISYYPEFMEVGFAINCPTGFMTLWKVASTVLDQNTADKMHVYSDDSYVEHMIKIMGAENVPTIYGGKCECPGGCIPELEMKEIAFEKDFNYYHENDERTKNAAPWGLDGYQ